MHATVMYGAGDVRIETVPNVVAVNATGMEITLGGAAVFIEDATQYLIFGRR
jgi:hypothetical protein